MVNELNIHNAAGIPYSIGFSQILPTWPGIAFGMIVNKDYSNCITKKSVLDDGTSIYWRRRKSALCKHLSGDKAIPTTEKDCPEFFVVKIG